MKADSIIRKARAEGRNVLLETEAKEMCLEYGISVPQFDLAHNLKKALQLAKKLGYPLVLKVVSPDIAHKTEAGGVLVNLKNAKEVEAAYARIISRVKASRPEAVIHGVMVQKMAPVSLELIVGAYRDVTFGPVVIFGLGGVLVEFYRDITSTLAPVSISDSKQMIQNIKGYRLLKGYRGEPPLDEESICSVISACSRMMLEQTAIAELDINPLLAYEEGVSAVDARISLSEL